MKTKETKTTQIQIRLTLTEKVNLNQLAKLNNCTMAEILKEKLKKEL